MKHKIQNYKVYLIFTSFVFLTYVCYWNAFFNAAIKSTKSVKNKIGGNTETDLKLTFETLGESLPEHENSITATIQKNWKTCNSPVSKFVYARTHKTGSSTTFTLLQAFITKHGLTKFQSAFYPRPNTGGYPGRFKCKFMLRKGASIVIHHSRFDANEMKSCFHPETRYFTTIREPWSIFLSAYNFYPEKRVNDCRGMPKAYIKQGKIMDTAEYLSKCVDLLNSSISFYFRFRNFQSHDLGIDPMLNDANEIQNQIMALDQNLDLVMLLEYYDESLILLKDLLCMDWNSLFRVGQKNSGHYVRRQFPNEKERPAFEQLYNIDIPLYNHFNRTFWKRVDLYGRDKMARDLETLRKQRKRRSLWEQQRIPPGLQMDAKFEEELQNYMYENSGKCFYPGWD